ncbi:MAG: tRNA (N6-threonylcarbamoyladenosine(37)-N6)-methyltransferase TrmO [Phycisphaerae bacterium]|nr:tRNA (N6-threonylcarbamoyladenosine(37)-N6)-methyltransferase TrmO [Phycisphaerae bacterium]
MMRTQDENIAHEEFRIHPIGRVVREGGKTLIVLDDKYQNGLLGLEKQKHVHVLYWFDRNDTPEKRAVLQVHPRGDRNNPLTGVFATHSPFRPNLIAISRCEIIAVRENVIEVAEIDAFDNTPVIDLKGDFFDYYRPAQER